MSTLIAAQLPFLYEEMGLSVDQLGCVMMSVEPLADLLDEEMGLSAADLYTSAHPDRHYIDGLVKTPHVTLLYGLLPGVSQQHIADVMADWEAPLGIGITAITTFPATFPEDDPDHNAYEVVVAEVQSMGSELTDAHARLSLLPHIDTHPDYRPHITLAYVKYGRGAEWRELLSLQLADRPTTSVDTSRDSRGLFGNLAVS